MLAANNLYIQYGDRILMNNINVVIGEKDKVGLVGRNGAGKSTLLKILAGYQNAQQGQVTKPTYASMGFLHQDMMIPKGKTVLEEAMSAFDEIREVENRMAKIQKELEERTDYESDEYMNLIEEFTDMNEKMTYMGGDTMQAEVERILGGLGFKQSDFGRLMETFSGGWQMRVELAKMLLRSPDYILLDEPTNHLDIESIIWLENFLKDYPGAVILISHDKQFLDAITTRTIEIELGKIQEYKAGYSEYMLLRKERREIQVNALKNQDRVIADKQRTIDRFMAKANKSKMAQSMQKQLDKVDRIEIDDEDIKAMNIRFPPSPRVGSIPMEGFGITKKYGETTVLNNVDIKIDRGDRVAFVGQNGQGKTTLAKILVDNEALTGGEVNLGHNIQIGYYAQNQAEAMYPQATLLETMEQHSPPEMRTQLRSILGAFMFSGEDSDKRVSVLSGGERARLAMACLLLKPINVLVLDEPTNHLDMISKDVLKEAIRKFDGTLIVVSHDRDFLADMTTRTIEFRDQKLYEHLGDVNYFLEKRALTDMRAVELATVKAPAPKADAVENPNKRQDNQKLVNQIEKKIADLEGQLADLEVVMGKADFYGSPKEKETTSKYNGIKADIDKAMEEWESMM